MTMTRVLAGCLLLLLTCGSGICQKTATRANTANEEVATVKDVTFHSASLQRDMRYRVLFPREYNRGRFPVLYLLHGLYGDYQNWDMRTKLENYARNVQLLIVMPDARDSWYTNSASVPGDKFEDYIAKDLISEVDEKYRTIRSRQDRAIAGLSMGGYGAVKLALKYPDLFAFAGSLSGALNAPQDLDTLRPEFRSQLLQVFGREGSPARADNDVFLLLDTSSKTPYPYLYLGCGTADPFLETNRSLALQLSLRKMTYEYHETPGGHTWEYWDTALKPMLEAMERSLVEMTSKAEKR